MTFKASYIPWILTAILAIAFFLYLKGCIGAKQAVAAGDNTKDSITYWKGIASLRKTPEDFAQATKGYLDSISKAYATKPANIKEVIRYVTKGTDTLYMPADSVVTIIRDSTTKQIAAITDNFENNYYSILAHLSAGGKGSYVVVNAFDTITTVFKTVTEGSIFNRKNFLQLDIKNSNPYVTVTGAHAYRQELPAPKKWALILGIGYGYGFGTSQVKPVPYIGLSVGKTLIRF